MYDQDNEDAEEVEIDDTAWMEFLEDALNHLLVYEDPERFLAWMRDEAPEMHPDAFPEVEPAMRRAMSTALGRTLWNNTPLPSAGLRTRPLPKPQRNDPCPCGSGRKYKACCAQIDAHAPALDLRQEDILPLVLMQLDDEEIDRLVEQRRIPPEALAHLAREILEEEDRPERAAELLEPLFEGNLRRLDHRHEMALDTLLDVYDELDEPEAGEALLQRVIEEGSKALRCSAWQRLAVIRIEEGESEEAWEAFHQAAKVDPDSLSLGVLEITLLLREQRMEQARERAGVWLARYRRDGIEDEYLVELMEQTIQDPEAAYRLLFEERDEEVDDEEDYPRRH